MKKGLFIALTSLFLGAFTPQPLIADCGSCSLIVPPCPGDYTLGADFLWWKPCIDDIDFAGTRTTTVDSTVTPPLTLTDFHYKGICPEWRPGVRINFDYPNLFTWCNIGMTATYTYVDMVQTHTVHGSDNIDILAFPGFVNQDVGANPIHGKWYMKYQTWDTMLYFNYCCCECLYITPSIGVAGLILNEQLKNSAITSISNPPITNVTTDVNWKSLVRGVGIKSGLDINFLYSRCLTFYGFANGSLLAAKAHTKYKEDDYYVLADTNVQAELRVKDHNCTRCVPGFHIGVGAQATFCICGFPISARAGYEFLQWYNIPKHRIFSWTDIANGNIPTSPSTTRTFGFHGPLVGLDLSF